MFKVGYSVAAFSLPVGRFRTRSWVECKKFIVPVLYCNGVVEDSSSTTL